MYGGLPWIFIQLNMTAELGVEAEFSMQVEHNFWLIEIGAEYVDADRMIVLTGFGMNMRHGLLLALFLFRMVGEPAVAQVKNDSQANTNDNERVL